MCESKNLTLKAMKDDDKINISDLACNSLIAWDGLGFHRQEIVSAHLS